MKTCEELLADYNAETDPVVKQAIRETMLAQECADPGNPENPEGSGGGGHVDPDGPHG